MEQRFFRCKKCGNIVAMVKASGVPIVCCGQPMEEIKPNTVEAAVEKHKPVIKVEGTLVTVTVGSVPHPMLPEHHIEWISLQTKFGNQRKALNAGEKPVAVFAILPGDEVECAYAYCNLHGLWKSE